MKKLLITFCFISLFQVAFCWTNKGNGDYRGTDGEFAAFNDGVKACINYNKKTIKELEEAKKTASKEECVVLDLMIEFLQQQSLDFIGLIDWVYD